MAGYLPAEPALPAFGGFAKPFALPINAGSAGK
jgi:hypothetical protein